MQEFTAEKIQQQGYKYQQLMKSFHKFHRNHSDELKKFGTTLMDPCRAHPFELYFNLFLMCAWLCFYFLSLFNVLFVARSFLFFVRTCLYHCVVF